MTIKLRLEKGAALTYGELDGNFTDLDTRTTSNSLGIANLNTSVAGLPSFYEDGEGDPAGIEHPTGTQYPLISQAVEVVSICGIPLSSTLTATDQVLDSFIIPAGSLGPNSSLQIEPLWTYTNSANNKILKVKIGGVTVYNVTRTTSTKEAPLIIIVNRNSIASQIQPYDNTYVTAGTGTPATYTINFANDVTVEFLGNRASGTDTLTLQYYRVLHYMGA